MRHAQHVVTAENKTPDPRRTVITSLVLAGAFDTKGEDFTFVKSLIEGAGVTTLTVDFGVMGEPAFKPDITREEVARAAGRDLDTFRDGRRKDEAMAAMLDGLRITVSKLYDEGVLGGIMGMGGTGGTSIATAAMRALPFGVPKLMVSTVGGGDVSAYAGGKDIVFFPSVVDVAGLNQISRTLYARAAGAAAGMMKVRLEEDTTPRPLLAASMFGNTTDAVEQARAALEEKGYEVLVFHATGAGGHTMEALLSEGFFRGALDLTTTELADYVCGGVFSAGPERGLAAPSAGVPTVLVPGCVDMANFGAPQTVPSTYRKRHLYEWNANVTLMRTNVEENKRIGELLAAAANSATGPVAVILPLGGVSMLDSAGNAFWDPEADKACFDTLKSALKPEVTVIEVEQNINDAAFARLAAETLLGMLERVER